MDALLLLISITLVFTVLGVLATAFGADTRDGFTEDHPFALSA